LYVGLCRDLEVSSFGETIEAAKQSLIEALGAFLEECEAMGTPEEVLQEAGFVLQEGQWLPPPGSGLGKAVYSLSDAPDSPTCASAASAWGSQKVISRAWYNSMAADKVAHACSRWPILA
jgi:hypothetical protein